MFSASFKSLGLWSPNRYEIDLSNEVLNIGFGQEAAKIPKVKVGVRRKISANSAYPGHMGLNQADWQISFANSNFEL